MIATINLLPWRQTRRRACLRFWSFLFGAWGEVLKTAAYAEVSVSF